MKKYTEPNFRSSAIITIDVQCDTLDGQPMEVPGTSAILPNIKKILDVYRKKNKPIVHIVRIYKEDGSNVDLCRKEAIENGAAILLQNSPGCELATEMFDSEARLNSNLLLSGHTQTLGENEIVMYKPRWGAFYDTSLEMKLNEFEVDTLIFTGCNFPNCLRTSIYEASERDFKIVVVEDAVSGLYSKGKEEILNIGIQVTTAKALTAAIL